MIRVSDIDGSDDMREINESLADVPLLRPENATETDTADEEEEEKIEAIGAIRAVQKKVIRIADEATTTPAPNPEKAHSFASLGHSSLDTGSRDVKDADDSDRDVTVTHGNSQVGTGREAVDTGSPDKEATTINLEDSFGTHFDIPHDLVRTWPVSSIKAPR